MDRYFSARAGGLAAFSALLLAACAGFGGSALKPGMSTMPEVLASMGAPAMLWKHPDGSEQMAYPRGPAGTQTFMVHVGPEGTLQRIEQVLDTAHFARVRTGMSKDEVLRALGPAEAEAPPVYFRNQQLTWSWLFCNSWNVQEFFDVTFDDASGSVIATGQHPKLTGPEGIEPPCGR